MSHPQNVLLALLFATVIAAGPCDIYQQGGTPCVAAHSTTRALFTAYQGPLYQVTRASDGQVFDVHPRVAGGISNATSQDSFCTRTTCLISKIYDQTTNRNHLTRAPGGSAAPKPDSLANATAAPVRIKGKKVYGVYMPPATGYRNDVTKGVAINDEPEGIYSVLDGSHYNNKCCFDYGNAEVDNRDDGPGTMEAIYFGSGGKPGKGYQTGNGPWIKAEMEDGLFPSIDENHPSPSISHRFVHAIVKGGQNFWAIRGGDATVGKLTTFYSGARPKGGYTKMRKQGAIVLGVGGDNSNGGEGTFYEGAMTSGLPSDAVEAAVQSDIVAAGYAPA